MQPPSRGQVPGQIPIQTASGQNLQAEAIGRAGAAIKQTGDLALQLKQEQDRQYYSDAELTLRRASKDLAGKLAQNFNPSTHQEEAQKYFDSVKSSILSNDDFSPRFQEDMAKRIDMFTFGKIEQIGTDAKLMQLENGSRLSKAVVNTRLADGDYDGAKQEVIEGIGIHRGKEDAQIELMRIDRIKQQDQREVKVSEGDGEYFDTIELPASDRARYKSRAETARSRMELDDVSKIKDAMELGDIGTKTDLIRNLEAAPNIQPKTAKLFLKNWDNNKPLSFEEETDLLNRMNGMHDDLKAGKIDLETYRKDHYQLQSEISALGNRTRAGGVRARISDLNPDGLEPGSLTSDKAEGGIQTMIKKASSKWATQGGYGSTDTPMEAFESGMTQELTEKAMMEWAKTEEGRNATPTQVKRQFLKEAANALSDIDIEDVAGDTYTLEDLTGILDMEAPGTLLPKINTMPNQ